MTTAPRPPSPADLRNHLNPTHVDALAAQLHQMTCLTLWGLTPTAYTIQTLNDGTFRPTPDHTDYDRSRARFLLTGLREHHGLTLTLCMDRDGNLLPPPAPQP